MNGKLSYYLKLNYPIEHFKIPDNLGGGYNACIPQLGKKLFFGDGETLEEALEDLKKTKKEIFADYLKRGVPIPKPVIYEEKPSGKLVVRMPMNLHAKLSEAAKSNNVSLNNYIVTLLSGNYSIERVNKKINEATQTVSVINVHMQSPEERKETESGLATGTIVDRQIINIPEGMTQ
jgi:predicted HicB family RNase H-like nuclease